MAREDVDLLIARAERNSRSGRAARRKLARVARGSHALLTQKTFQEKFKEVFTTTIEIAQKFAASFDPNRVAEIFQRDLQKELDRVTFKV